MSQHLSILFGTRGEGENSRSETEEAGDPALEHPPGALGLGDVADDADEALVGLGGHDLRLDDVDGAGDGGGGQAGEEGSGEVGGEGVAEGRPVEEEPLGGVVAGEPGSKPKRYR